MVFRLLDTLQECAKPVLRRGTKISWQHLDQVLFDAASRGDHNIYHLMLDEVANLFPDATGGHVGGVAQEDLAPSAGPVAWVLLLLLSIWWAGLVC